MIHSYSESLANVSVNNCSVSLCSVFWLDVSLKCQIKTSPTAVFGRC